MDGESVSKMLSIWSLMLANFHQFVQKIAEPLAASVDVLIRKPSH